VEQVAGAGAFWPNEVRGDGDGAGHERENGQQGDGLAPRGVCCGSRIRVSAKGRGIPPPTCHATS
jgi:hypothetical protein